MNIIFACDTRSVLFMARGNARTHHVTKYSLTFKKKSQQQDAHTVESFPSDQYVLAVEVQDTAAAELDLFRGAKVSINRAGDPGLLVNDTWLGIPDGLRIKDALCMLDRMYGCTSSKLA